MTEKTIVVLCTLDTKGVEAQYVREQIEGMGARALVVDVGVVGQPTCWPDVTRREVARAGGTELDDLLIDPDREIAAPIMAAGATKIVCELVAEGRVHGIVAMGGTQGTTLATAVMRDLPYGFPKVMVSTMASSNVAPWVDIKDITMMFSVTDILGLNPVMRTILANAAGAVVGMADATVPMDSGHKPLVGVTTVGITTQGAMKAIEVLEDAGYETIVFHAIGPGGRAMEQLMEEGIIGAVLDYSTIEVSNQMYDALLAADDKRLTTAGKLGLPQVLAPGAIEVLVFNEPETVPPPFNTRTLIRHSPKITDVRLNADEMRAVGQEVARRLGSTTDDAIFMIPSGGYDSYAVEGGGFHDPGADQAFVDALKAGLPPNIQVIERDTHIDDPAFATEAAQLLIQLIEGREPRQARLGPEACAPPS
jgi:uncharacterized protein (UPF0261 family)